MGVFQKMKNGLIRFMYGRNGPDQLGQVIIWGVLLLDLLILPLQRNVLLHTVLYWFSMAGWGYAVFRMFSKSLYKRREENQKWLNWWWRVKNRGSGARERHADKDHKYFTCKTCKTICRVPVGKGVVEITCPKCGSKIRGKT